MPVEEITSGGTTLAVLDDLPVRLPDGAVLVRGLGLDSPEAFHAVVEKFGEPWQSYRGGNTPRTTVSDGVFTSTEYPAEYPISQHNELSYAAAWPERLFFCCLVAATSGGATPVTDGRAVLADLDPGVLERFTSVVYRQFLHGGHGFGKSWQDTFETTDRSAVEDALRGADFGWTDDGSLRVSQRRAGVVRHPRTGEEAWFNQAEQWHPSSLPADEREALLELVGDERDLPHSVTYGDGRPIPVEDLAEVRRAIERNTVAVPWQAGDLLIVDNVLAMHGRQAYAGERRVLVAMT